MDSMGEVAHRVWVDDDHPIFRRGLVAVLRAAKFEVVGEGSGLRPCPELDDCDLLAFQLTAERLHRIRDEGMHESIATVALAARGAEDLLCEAVEAGVDAVLPRGDLTPERLTVTLRAAAAGAATLPADLLPELLARAARGSSSTAGLTDRELDVLRLLADGETTKGMAAELAYSERTIKNIVHDVLVKMNGRNRTHAVALAARQGLV